MTNDDLEAVLRASLAVRAAQAPSGELLAERIIADADLRPVRDFHTPREPRWRAWTLPLIAAGSVAAIVGALVGVSHLHHTAAPLPPADTHVVSPSPSPSPSHGTSPVVPPATATPANPAGITGFHVVDLTFDGADDGYALGSSHCLSGVGTCTALVHTTDGTHWTAITGQHSTPFNVAADPTCATSCVSHIRFATDQIGYIFGPSAFFMTTNGGVSWTQEQGGADALETLDQNVIRLVSDGSGCPGPCNVRVQLAAVGSPHWTTVALPGGALDLSAVTLARTGSYAVIQAQTGDAANGLSTTLFTSTDAGASWTERADPCPQSAGTALSTAGLSTGDDHSVNILCSPGGEEGSPQVIVTSTNGGVSFTTAPRVQLPAGGRLAAIGAVSSRILLGEGEGTLYRSTDGGTIWARIAAVRLGEGTGVPFFGFENAAAGRIVTDTSTASTVWTTHDAGLTWSSVTYG